MHHEYYSTILASCYKTDLNDWKWKVDNSTMLVKLNKELEGWAINLSEAKNKMRGLIRLYKEMVLQKSKESTGFTKERLLQHIRHIDVDLSYNESN